ncbi:MAG: SAM-dependent methyltransferase [bacterium]
MKFLVILGIVFVIYVIWKYWTLLLGAGYDPTPMNTVYRMLELAQVSDKDIVYDLGSGDGRIIINAARIYRARAVGIEADPFRFLFSWMNILISGQIKRARVKFGNFFRKDISNATVITLFLFKPTNNRLKTKLMKELKPGTRIVTYIWTFDDWEAQTSVPEQRIYLYRIEKAIEGDFSCMQSDFPESC